MRIEPSHIARPVSRPVPLAAALVIFLLAVSACGPAAEDPAGPGAEASEIPTTGDDGGSAGAAAQPADPFSPADGGITAVVTDIILTPQAQVYAEKYMCVCGCGLRLGRCSCQKEPGGITMKSHLQSLVDQRLSPPDVTAAMVEKYGRAVLP
jgi:hypothetical protein